MLTNCCLLEFFYSSLKVPTQLSLYSIKVPTQLLVYSMLCVISMVLPSVYFSSPEVDLNFEIACNHLLLLILGEMYK